MELFDWLSIVWQHLNEILEDFCDADATIGMYEYLFELHSVLIRPATPSCPLKIAGCILQENGVDSCRSYNKYYIGKVCSVHMT